MSEGLLDVDAAARFLGITPEDLTKLATDGVIARQSGKFHPVQLVRGYIDHIKSAAERVQYLTQIEAAQRLDMSERNFRDVCASLGIDHRVVPFDEIAIAYIRDLREKAAGRGGDDQQSLTRARTSEASASAELKILQIQEKAGKLVPVDLIEPMLLAMVTAARIELLALPDKLANELKALHGVEIDASLIEEHIHAVLAHLAKTLPGLIAENDATGGESVEAAAETFDD